MNVIDRFAYKFFQTVYRLEKTLKVRRSANDLKAYRSLNTVACSFLKIFVNFSNISILSSYR